MEEMLVHSKLSLLKNSSLNDQKKNNKIIWLVLGGAAFSSTMVLPGVSLADVSLLCFSVILLFHIFKYQSIYLPNWVFYCLLLITWAIVGGFYVNNFLDLNFSEIEFAKSFLKLCFYILGSIFLAHYIFKIDSASVANTIFNILVLNAIISIYIYLAMSLPRGLPYEFFWFWQEGPVTAGYFRGDVNGYVRARGVFSEPSSLGIFQTLGLAFLYFKTELLKTISWRYLIILFSVLLTFSMASYFLLLVAMFIYYRRNLFRYTFLLSILLLIISLTAPVQDVFQEIVVDRVYRIIQGTDNSANARLYASWEIPFKILSFSPIFGAGLGNMENAVSVLNSNLKYENLLSENLQGWNVLAYILGTMGIVGLLIFIVLIIKLGSVNIPLSFFFICFMFTSGRFLEPLLWIYYVLYSKTQSR